MALFDSRARQSDLHLVEDYEPAPNPVLAPPPRELAIRVDHVSLSYPVGATRRGSMKSAIMSLAGGRDRTPKAEYVTALRNVNMDISRGERVALIGHNGSGKSTLLRTMAGIYPISDGTVTVTGRIGTLLEIGLGFEQESTGRENIYYRGMTLGYSRKQLREVEEDIVRFADIGEFIDLPMRTYSAGMFVRLGFAISTQFAPEILLIDEVFGAGDAAFSRRAIDRMNNIVDRAGICVIATHDLGLVQSLCTRAIWLDRGVVRRDGPPTDVAQEMLEAFASE